MGKIVEITGLCVYCGKPAKQSCSLCGALVCEAHYDATKGVCTACARGKQLKK